MGQAPRALTPHTSLWHFLGSELRLWRVQAGLSMDELGERVHFSGDTIAKVEKAERSANPRLIEACDRELGAAGALTRLLTLATEHAGDANQDHRNPQPAPPSTTSGAIPAAPGDEVDELSRALVRRHLSASTVRALADLVQTLRRLDDEIGPARLLGSVTGNLAWVTQLLGEVDHRGAPFQGLCKVAGELAQLAGWLSFDMNRSDAAVRHLRSAHRAADAADDAALGAYALGWRSLVVSQTDPAAGLALARAARRQAGGDVASSVNAWLSRVEAESLAGTGDRTAAEQALDQITLAAGRPRSERDPSWTYFIDAGQIAAYKGVVYMRLGDGPAAEVALREALDALQPSFVRDRCLYLTYLAAAHLQQRQPEIAAAVAADAFRLATETDSPRSITRLRHLRRGLDAWPSLPAVQELDELLEVH